MTSELRKITFDQTEVQAALVNHCLRSKIYIPDANIDKITLHDTAEGAAVLYFTVSNPADPHEVTLNRDNLAAALIRYAMDQGIPLPRIGQKILAIKDGAVSLMINIHTIIRKQDPSVSADLQA
ncbi:MAG: hypothetical protein OEY85_11525 [Rhodospirillales bacterium]|nr:hypothetical protein [Rhodospirillales bacterium]